ncbi:MAG: hypothetical protein QM723_33190 [Myxococcaceae bacterium]
MSVGDIKNTFTRIAQDKKIDAKDVDTILTSAGSISKDEEAEIRKEADQYAGIMDADASKKLKSALGDIADLRKQASSINHKVEVAKKGLDADIKTRLTAGTDTKTFGGTQIPEAVKTVMRDAFAKGAAAYDVQEMKPDPVYDTEHGEAEMTLDGKYNPYGQKQKAVDSMAFDYTELTPDKIAQDISTTQTWQEQAGYKTVGGNQEATFKPVTGKPSGNITELYDEASWSETKARGPGGQKYASNFAILADGSVHCVPASRRTNAEPWRILTTASLARGKQMAFNGHLHMEGGVVTYVGQSGRLGKLAEKGDGKFVDPVEVLKAWGFKLAPGLKVTQE